MDTLGNLVDKQITVFLKLHHSKDEAKTNNLTNQLERLTEEINSMSIDVLQSKISADDAMRPQHKTY